MKKLKQVLGGNRKTNSNPSGRMVIDSHKALVAYFVITNTETGA